MGKRQRSHSRVPIVVRVKIYAAPIVYHARHPDPLDNAFLILIDTLWATVRETR